VGDAKKRTIWHGGDPDRALSKAEGLLAKLRETPPEHRPKQMTIQYLAHQYHVSVQTMKGRVADAESKRRLNDYADNWLEIIYQIGNVLGETTAAKTFAIAHDVSNRNAFNAQKFILERTDPTVYGATANTVEQAPARAFISDVPQEVFDDLDEVAEQQLAEIEQLFANAQLMLTQWVRRQQKKIADQRVQEVDADDTAD
jgi:hypothetical protein